MKVLYSTASSAEFSDFKRLLLLATEIGFMDRPSVTFGNWGTIGADSPMRRLNSHGSPVMITVEAPPSGPAAIGYQKYIEADLANPEFVKIFFDGLAADQQFAEKFIQFKADYGGTRGQEVWSRLVSDTELASKTDIAKFGPSGAMYRVDSARGRAETLHVLLVDASIAVTAAQTVAARTGFVPITENPAFARLLALRTSSKVYVGDHASKAAWLAPAAINSVIPDEIIQRVSVADILTYREKQRMPTPAS